MDKGEKTLRVRVLGAGALTFPLVAQMKAMASESTEFSLSAGSVGDRRLHVIREIAGCKVAGNATVTLKKSSSKRDKEKAQTGSVPKQSCTDRGHEFRISDLLNYKREVGHDELIVLAITEGHEPSSRDSWRATRWSYEHCMCCEGPVVRKFLVKNADNQPPVVIVVLSEPSKPPPCVSAADLQALSKIVFARGIVTVPCEQGFKATDVWQKVIALAAKKPSLLPSCPPTVKVVVSGTVEQFKDLLKSGEGFRSMDGFSPDETAIGSYMDRSCHLAKEKFEELLAEEGARMTRLHWEEAVLSGASVSSLVRWQGLKNSDDYDFLLSHPLGKVIYLEVVNYLNKKKVALPQKLKEAYLARVLDLSVPPDLAVNYSSVFLESDYDMHHMRNRMEYLVQHRLFDHAKAIIFSIGSVKSQNYAPERNALYRAVWLQLCKLDGVAPGNQGWISWAPNGPDGWRVKALSAKSPQFLYPLFEPLSLQALASLAILLHPSLRLMSLPPHIWSVLATPLTSYFCFMRMAPVMVQNRFREIFKMLAAGIPFNSGSSIVVKNVHGYREREDYGKGEIVVRGELMYIGYKLDVSMDDQGYLELKEGANILFKAYTGTQMDSVWPEVIGKNFRAMGMPAEDIVPFLIILYNWIRYGTSPSEVLCPERLCVYQLGKWQDKDTKPGLLPLPFWWINVNKLFMH